MSSRAQTTVLLPTRVVGGHERMLLQWLAAARELGAAFEVACAAEPPLLQLIRGAGFEPRPLPYEADAPGRRRAVQWRNFACSWRFARSSRSAWILLAPGAMQTGLSHLLACVLAGKRVACYVPMAHASATLGASHPRLRDALTRGLACRVSLWITVTPAQREALIRRWHVRTPVHVIANRIDVPAAAPAAAPGAPDPALRLLFLGRFDRHQKGLDWLLELMSSSCATHRSVHLTLQGQGPFEPELRRLAAAQPDRVNVRPWGPPGGALADCDALLLCSRFEGFPLVAVEALRAGRPVIASQDSGLQEVLPAACQFAFGDDEGFWRAVHRMRDPALRSSCATQARARLDELLDASAYRQAVGRLVQALGCGEPAMDDA